MNKVFVTQAVRGIDYTQLEDYGEVIFLTDMEYPRDPTTDTFRYEVWTDMDDHFIGYRPGVDYVALSPSPMSVLMTGVMMAHKPGRHKILKWNGRSNRHDVMTMDTVK